MIFDRDSIFSDEVVSAIKKMGVKPVRTSRGSPWQNCYCERWIGSCRRELLDHIIPLSELHLLKRVREYVSYYHADRCHLSLGKDCPIPRPVQKRPSDDARVVALPRVGGLHHRYEWRVSA